MSKGELIYKTGTASENDIHQHLMSCDDSFIPPLSTRISLTDYAKKIFNNAVTFEAWDHKQLVGLIAAYFNKETNTGFITNVSVIKAHMSAGIASELLRSCMDYALVGQYTDIKLEVFKNNIPAIHFYKKYNFIQTSIKDDYITMNLHLNHQ